MEKERRPPRRPVAKQTGLCPLWSGAARHQCSRLCPGLTTLWSGAARHQCSRLCPGLTTSAVPAGGDGVPIHRLICWAPLSYPLQDAVPTGLRPRYPGSNFLHRSHTHRFEWGAGKGEWGSWDEPLLPLPWSAGARALLPDSSSAAQLAAPSGDNATSLCAGNGRARLGVLCHCSWGEPCTGTTGTNRSTRDHMVTNC